MASGRSVVAVVAAVVAVVLYGRIADVIAVTPFEEYGVVTPKDPFRFVGEALRLDCNITNTEVREDSSSLYFQHDDNSLPTSSMRVLNTRSIRLTVPSVSVENEGSYTCLQRPLLGYSPRLIGHQHVTVDYKPKEVVNHTCRVFNWEEMTCSWDLGINFRHPGSVNVSVYWVTVLPAASSSKGMHSDCPILTRTSCRWNRPTYTHGHTYRIRVIVSYVKKEKVLFEASKQFVVNTLLFVEPAPVHELRAKAKSSSCVELSFQHLRSVNREKVFLASVKTSEGEWRRIELIYKSQVVKDRSFYMAQVCSLQPHTQYRFRVAVMPAPALPDEGGGHLSQWRHVTVWTEQGVPTAPPITCPACYFEVDVKAQELKGTRRVRIMWKDIPEAHRHGNLLHYNITYTGLTNSLGDSFISEVEPGKPIVTSLDLDLPSRAEDYQVRIAGATEKGESQHAAIILVAAIEKQPPPPDRFLVSRRSQEKAGARRFYLSWAALNTQTHMMRVTQDLDLGSVPVVQPPLVSDLFIVWCQGERRYWTCQDDLEWVRLPSNQVTFELDTGLVGVDPYDLLIGVAARSTVNGTTYNSGIHWSRCVYIQNQKPETAPLNVRFSSSPPTNGLTLLWEKPGCREETSYVTEYLVIYCQTSSGGACVGERQKLNVSSDVTRATLYNLASGAKYLVHVVAVSSAGLGPPSNQISQIVAADPPEESVMNLVVIIVIIISIFLFVIILSMVIRRCYNQKRKVPNIKGLLAHPPSQTRQMPHHHQNRPLPDPPSEACGERHIYGRNSRRACMNNLGSEKGRSPSVSSGRNSSRSNAPLITGQAGNTQQEHTTVVARWAKQGEGIHKGHGQTTPEMVSLLGGETTPIPSHFRQNSSTASTGSAGSYRLMGMRELSGVSSVNPEFHLSRCATLPLRGHGAPPQDVAMFPAATQLDYSRAAEPTWGPSFVPNIQAEPTEYCTCELDHNGNLPTEPQMDIETVLPPFEMAPPLPISILGRKALNLALTKRIPAMGSAEYLEPVSPTSCPLSPDASTSSSQHSSVVYPHPFHMEDVQNTQEYLTSQPPSEYAPNLPETQVHHLQSDDAPKLTEHSAYHLQTEYTPNIPEPVAHPCRTEYVSNIPESLAHPLEIEHAPSMSESSKFAKSVPQSPTYPSECSPNTPVHLTHNPSLQYTPNSTDSSTKSYRGSNCQFPSELHTNTSPSHQKAMPSKAYGPAPVLQHVFIPESHSTRQSSQNSTQGYVPNSGPATNLVA